MKAVERLLYLFAAISSVLTSCSVDNPYYTPEGTVRIFADKTRLAADGVDAVSLKVMYGSEDVTSKPTCTIHIKGSNSSYDLTSGAGSFSTSAPGTYEISATYYYGGDIDSDNKLTVEATAVQNGKYYQKLLGMQFTSTLCPSCPELSSTLKSVQEDYPGRVAIVSFHVSAMGDDPMWLNMSDTFFKSVADGTGLPAFAFNVRKNTQHIISEYSKIEEEMQHQLDNYPCTCGVALETSLDANVLTVKVKINSEVSSKMKYHVFLVEDGLSYSQLGADDGYLHNNVLRYCKSDSVWGTNFNSFNALEPGKEYVATTTITLDDDWNVGNLRVVAAAMTSSDGGTTYACNNVNECAAGSSADYVLSSGAQEESRFRKHVSVIEFTGQWCAQCPEGATTINYFATQSYPGLMHVLAFHNAGGGADVFAIPQEAVLYGMFNPGGYPGYAIDMHYSGTVNGGSFSNDLKSAFATDAHCGVSLTCSIGDGFAKVEGKLFPELTSEYRLAVYVTEDKIVATQNVGGTYKDNYTHRHVVRRMLSADVRGDALGQLQAGKERSFDYSLELDPSWNTGNLSVCVLVIGDDGYVSNCAECKVDGGNCPYDELN
ncbi:MAG: Omp28-related outer membrane protein [Candidatus Cryptobacteroides sp.]